eukprot:5894203-Prymnesium_polylepis.1
MSVHPCPARPTYVIRAIHAWHHFASQTNRVTPTTSHRRPKKNPGPGRDLHERRVCRNRGPK